MSTCLLQYEELTLGGADELPVKKKEGNVTFVLDQTGFFPLKGNGTVIFSLADNDLLYIPHKLTASLSPSVVLFSALLRSCRKSRCFKRFGTEICPVLIQGYYMPLSFLLLPDKTSITLSIP